MKFMKLGSKPDQFHSDGENIRYIATELASDITIIVGDVKFYVHKFPLVSKCSLLQKLVAELSDDEINLSSIPGGPAAFEICTKFCYNMVVTLNAYNVVLARCASEFLGMHENVEKGNLVYKIDVFLSSCIFRTWKDSIVVLQTTKSFVPWSQELNIISCCVGSIASKATMGPSKVKWSYTYNRKKLPSGIEYDSQWNGQHVVPKDWWVEDLCELSIEPYKEVIIAIRATGVLAPDAIGGSLIAYASKKLPGLSHGSIQGVDVEKSRYLVDSISYLLPKEKGSVSCGFLLSLLHSSIILNCKETAREELMLSISRQLEDSTISDLLFSSPNGEMALYNMDVLHKLVRLFVDRTRVMDESLDDPEIGDASKTKVAKLVDDYLAEAARDPSLSSSQFISLAEMVSGFPRSNHDAIYQAIDMYLKEHPDLPKIEKRRICQLMDCRKLSTAACSHAVQNDRLPMRVVVQVMFFQQAQSAAANGGQTPGFPGLLPRGSYGSSRSATTNSDDDWDVDHDELKDHRQSKTTSDSRSSNVDKASRRKMRIFARFWSNKDRTGEHSSSDTSDSPASTSAEEAKEMIKAAGQIANQMKKKLQLTR